MNASLPAVAQPRDRSFIFLLASLTGLTALSIDMSLPAMPQLEQTFKSNVATVQLTLSLFLLGFALGQLVCGPISDRIGRRPVLLAGLVVFTLTGFLCAFSPSLPMLIAGRFLQGIGASVGPIIARAIVRDCYDHNQASGVLSQMTQVMIVAPLLAPTLGGYVLIWFGWPAIFWILGASGALIGLISWRRLPETQPRVAGAADSTMPLWTGIRTVLANRTSMRYTLTSCFAYAGMFAYVSGSPFVFIDVFQIPREKFGLFFAITAAALMVGATVNRTLIHRYGGVRLFRWGLSLLFAASLMLGLVVYLGLGGLWGVILPMMLYLFSLGLVQPNAMAAAMAPHGKLAGLASSLIGSLQTVGGALTGFCVAHFYNHTPQSLAGTVAVAALLAFVVAPSSRATALEATADGCSTNEAVLVTESEI